MLIDFNLSLIDSISITLLTLFWFMLTFLVTIGFLNLNNDYLSSTIIVIVLFFEFIIYLHLKLIEDILSYELIIVGLILASLTGGFFSGKKSLRTIYQMSIFLYLCSIGTHFFSFYEMNFGISFYGILGMLEFLIYNLLLSLVYGLVLASLLMTIVLPSIFIGNILNRKFYKNYHVNQVSEIKHHY